MHSVKNIFISMYNSLLRYYNSNNLAYFVTNKLIKSILHKDYISLNKENILSKEIITILKQYIYNITISNMPYQYILKEITFCNTVININPPILIPRIETEELVEYIINKLTLHKNNYLKIIDFCSGSGCIGIALLNFFINSKCTAFEINHQAVTLSSKNAIINNLKNRFKVYQKDILSLKKNKKYNLIISNPPYISLIDYNKLDDSVKKWESREALTDNKSGYSFIIYLLKISKKKLDSDGLIVIEICHSYGDFILSEAKKIYKKELSFLYIDQYEKKRAIFIIKGKYVNLFNSNKN